jgi:translocator protein
MNKTIKLILSILLCQSAGIIGSFFTVSAIPTWYATLNKPFFSPPNWLFAPVWTLLYALMGVFFYILWESKKKRAKSLQRFFLAHLFINALWSVVFFGLKSLFGALLIILVLLSMILYLIIKSGKVSRIAPYLLFPYLFWVSFATILNIAVWLIN